MATMRDYLAARSVYATTSICSYYLTNTGFFKTSSEYIYSFWAGFFIMEWLTLRVAGDVLQRSLRGLPGLQAPAKTTFRWAQIAAMLLALPAGVAVAILFLRPGEDWSAL